MLTAILPAPHGRKLARPLAATGGPDGSLHAMRVPWPVALPVVVTP
jgi:hypothetical protein